MTLRERIGLLGLICAMTANAYTQQTIYVNGTTGNDAWTGLCEVWDGGTCGPKATIQAGIDAAVNGDAVLVGDGAYTGTGNKSIDFHGKAITVRSVNGPDTCIIDCQGSGLGFDFHSGETLASVVKGFTVTGGGAGGMSCYNSSASILRCIIAYNVSDWNGGGICLSTSMHGSCHTVIRDCLIVGNTGGCGGGGVYAYASWYGTEAVMTGCTVVGNMCDHYDGGAAGYGGFLTVNGCILWDNAPDQLDGWVTVLYSDIEGGWGGAGNITDDPLFVDPNDADYHLMAGSPLHRYR